MPVDPSDRVHDEDPLESTLELPALDLEVTGEDLDSTARNRAIQASELPRFEAEVQQLSADVARLLEQLEQRDRQLAERAEATTALEALLAAERSRADALQGRIEELETRSTEERQTFDRLRGELEAQLRHARSDESSLRSRVALYAERLRNLEGRRGLWENLLRDGFVALDAETAIAREARLEVERAREEMEGLRAEARSRAQEVEQRFAAERAAAAQAQVELLARATALEEQLAIRAADYERRVAELRAEHESESRLRGEEAERLLAETRSQAETRLTEVQAAAAARLDELERSSSARIAELERSAARTETEAADLRLRLQDLEARHRELEARSQRETAALLARTELAETRSRKAQMELELKTARLQVLEALAQNRSAASQPAPAAVPTPASTSGVESMASVVSESGLARYLVMLDGGSENVYLLGRRTTIGRGDDNDIRVLRNSVSRHHAVILVGASSAVIEDLKSTNGVLVNRRRTERSVLRDGDIVHIGKCKFRYSERPRMGSAA